MKKYLISLVCASFLCTNGLYAGHLKDIYENAKISSGGGGNFKHQKAYWRDGGGHLGGYSAKWGSSSFNLVNIQPPHMKAGCNGIDIGWGGIDFISFDELKEKASQIMKNAQGYAFKLAISTLCKECEAVLSALEDVSNMINNMNFDTCELATKGVESLFAAAGGNSIADGKGSGWASEWAKGSQERAKAISDFTSEWVGKTKGWISGDKDKNQAIAFGYGSVLSNIYNFKQPKIFGIDNYDDYYTWAAFSLGSDLHITFQSEKQSKYLLQNLIKEKDTNNFIDNSVALDKSLEYLFNDTNEQYELEIDIYGSYLIPEENSNGKPTAEKMKTITIDPISIFSPIKIYLSSNFYHILSIMAGNNDYKIDDKNREFLNTFPNDMKDALNSIVYLSAIKDMHGDLNFCKNYFNSVITHERCALIKEQVNFYVKEFTYELATQNFITFLDNLSNQLAEYQKSDAFDPKDKDIAEKYEHFQEKIKETKSEFYKKLEVTRDKIFKRKQEIRQQAAALEAAKLKQAQQNATEKLNGGQK